MFKKITSSIIMVLLLIGIVAYAEPDITANFQINYTTNKVTLSGKVTDGSSHVTITVEGPNNRLVYIGSAKVINSTYTKTFGLAEPIKGLYKVKIKSDKMSVPIDTDFKYEIIFNIDVSLTADQEFDICATVSNMADVSAKTFVLEYNPAHLTLTDIIKDTMQNESNAGSYGRINIISVNNGEIVFRVADCGYSEYSPYSGILNVFEFKALMTTDSTVSLKYE